MQNVDPVFILQPLVVIVFSTALIVYWHFRRSLGLRVLVFSLIAYGFASP